MAAQTGPLGPSVLPMRSPPPSSRQLLLLLLLGPSHMRPSELMRRGTIGWVGREELIGLHPLSPFASSLTLSFFLPSHKTPEWSAPDMHPVFPHSLLSCLLLPPPTLPPPTLPHSHPANQGFLFAACGNSFVCAAISPVPPEIPRYVASVLCTFLTLLDGPRAKRAGREGQSE